MLCDVQPQLEDGSIVERAHAYVWKDVYRYGGGVQGGTLGVCALQVYRVFPYTPK